MQDSPYDPEEADDFEGNLHRLNDAVRRLQADLAVQSELLLALTNRVFQLERGRAPAPPPPEPAKG